MLKFRLALVTFVLALGTILGGCKKDPDQALVTFKVSVATGVMFQSVDFTVENPPGAPPQHLVTALHSFQYGYYMPLTAQKIAIDAIAYRDSNSKGCIVGRGTLTGVGPVVAGQALMATGTLMINAAPEGCSGSDGGVDRPAKSDGGGAAGKGGDAAVEHPRTGDDETNAVMTGKQTNGKACGMDGDCQSGFCRDGVCCNEACSGQCKACAATFTGGADGTCANVMAGASSRGACTDETATNACGHDGTCDGAGQCKSVGAGQACGQGTCTDAHTFQGAGQCNGAGACTTPAKTDCGTYPCASTGCAKPCTAAADCAAGQYCSNGTCKVTKTLGTTCMAATECGSGFCSPDQVCCDKACTGACTACLKATTGQADGMCAPVQLGQDPHNDCAPDAAGSCGKDGNCDGKGACHLTTSGTSCGSASCSGSTFTPGKACNGTGMCAAAGSAMDCGQNACTTDGCKSACAVDADCGTSAYCDKTTSKCTGKKNNGTACAVGNECTSGACVEGVCCNTACSGTCLSCLAAKTGGASGTCAFITAGMPDSRCTAADKSTCGQDGNCNGAGQCEKWSSSTVCAASTCTGGNYLAARTCSNGVCNPAAQTACGGAVCDPTTGCRTTCTAASDCTGNTYCDATTKKCLPLKTNGTACGTDGTQCASGLCVDGVCCNSQCGGQCQSCSTGTCANVKTARTPCSGSGTCGGACDGTSPSCVFPGTTVACGSTGCMSTTTAYVTGKCSGSGSCSGATTQMCTGGQVCTGTASCGCPSSAPALCNNTCVATNTDTHCGSCTACAAGTHCSSGSCVECTTDSQCSGGKTCQQNKCTCPSTTPACGNTCCASSSCCVNGACQAKPTWYRDFDGDGFGDSGTTSQACTQPTGYVPDHSDCCDKDGQVHPGSNACSSNLNGCGAYDYDCSGQETECNTPVSTCPNGDTSEGLCSSVTNQCFADSCLYYGYGFDGPGCGISHHYLVTQWTCYPDASIACDGGEVQMGGDPIACH
jgi:hypothetical protein